MNRLLRPMPAVFLFLILWGVTAGNCFAHRVVIFAWMEGDTVYTESQFPDGRKIADATVKVFDPQKELLLTGKTDAVGEFSFKVPEIPASTDLTIVLEAGMGHQGSWHLSREEINSALGKSDPSPDSATPIRSVQKPGAGDTGSAISAPTGITELPVNEKELARIIDTAVEKALEKQMDHQLDKKLDEKLQPLHRMLARMQDPGPTVNDIFSGIGYILGLAGVAALFYSGKKNRK